MPNPTYGQPIVVPQAPGSVGYNVPTPSGFGVQGATVGNFGTIAAANAQNGNTAGAQPGNAYLPPPGAKTAPPLLSGMQDYGDYQNFGTIAQGYGAQGAGQLNTPAVTSALGRTQAGAEGLLGGQANANNSVHLLEQAAFGNTPSAADIQQRAGIQQGLAQAQSQAASTRGNFGLANAQKQAMAAQATGATQGATQGSALRAQEMAQAQGQYAQAAGAQASNQTAAAAANYAAQAQNQGTNLGYLTGQQQAYQNQAQTALGAAEGQGNLDIGQGAQNTQQNIANQQITQGYVSGGAQAAGALLTGAALMSDERTKRDIRGNAGDVLSQLDQFKPMGFSYKAANDTPNQQAADAPQVGVLAQDVEKGPAGRMLVRHDELGRKVIDVPSMTGVLAAGEGALKQGADDHEARIAKLEALLRGGGGPAQPMARAS
jgi:hypothetical protein